MVSFFVRDPRPPKAVGKEATTCTSSSCNGTAAAKTTAAAASSSSCAIEAAIGVLRMPGGGLCEAAASATT
jgi:hypothetical protein